MDAIKPNSGDVFLLNPDCFDGNTKTIKTLDYFKINDHNSFSITNNKSEANGIILSHPINYYTVKDVIEIIYKFLFRKIKSEHIEAEWIGIKND